jgi:hypothetical protein
MCTWVTNTIALQKVACPLRLLELGDFLKRKALKLLRRGQALCQPRVSVTQDNDGIVLIRSQTQKLGCPTNRNGGNVSCTQSDAEGRG